MLPTIRTPEELTALVQKIGFLPFFTHEIKGFSIEECCPPELWFSPVLDGPWEWKGPVARSGCVYGKFFRGKAGFISLNWFPDFANYRRDGYDFDARFDDELASFKDKMVFDEIDADGPLLSKELKERCNCKGFDGIITRLQMQTYITIADFVYMQDKTGKPYGWGIAKYATPEQLYGYDRVTAAYKKDPAESRDKILQYLTKLLPQATEKQLLRLIK